MLGFFRMRRFLALMNLIFTTIFLSLISVFLAPFDPKGEKVNRIGRLWAIIHLKVCGIKIVSEGMENIYRPPYIFMCNHQSVLDIFTLLVVLRISIKWIAKKELFSIPFVGWSLKIGKNISLDRENPRKALIAMQKAARRLKDGMSIVIFPEGTWSLDGNLLPFKKGGFSLALKTGISVVPVGITGTGQLQPEGCFVPKAKGTIHINIGKPVPIPNREKGNSAKTELLLHVRARMEELIIKNT